ncbi:MAG: IclR family transcriptional regulator [Nocardiopsaceae bacterium]|jgi:urocanate hydratase|nr:IclR family transcriptional regulator [Nocardiopsaceae bacterium]
MEFTRAVDRALRLLTILAESQEPVSLMEGSREAALAPSTASRLLRSLESSGFASRDREGRYFVGSRFLKIAATALNSRPYLRTGRLHLEVLSQETGESAYIGVADDSRQAVIYIQHVPSPRAIRHWDALGRIVPIKGTAIGAALTGRTGPKGYAVRRGGVEPDVTAIAAPVRWFDKIAAAISVIGPTFRISDEDADRIGELVVAHAEAISATAIPFAEQSGQSR